MQRHLYLFTNTVQVNYTHADADWHQVKGYLVGDSYSLAIMDIIKNLSIILPTFSNLSKRQPQKMFFAV